MKSRVLRAPEKLARREYPQGIIDARYSLI